MLVNAPNFLQNQSAAVIRKSSHSLLPSLPPFCHVRSHLFTHPSSICPARTRHNPPTPGQWRSNGWSPRCHFQRRHFEPRPGDNILNNWRLLDYPVTRCEEGIPDLQDRHFGSGSIQCGLCWKLDAPRVSSDHTSPRLCGTESRGDASLHRILSRRFNLHRHPRLWCHRRHGRH